MNRVLRNALAIVGGVVLLDVVSRRRGRGPSAITRTLLGFLRPTPVSTDTLEARVRHKLARTATRPDAITIAIEHGCVDLRGAVPTRERPHIVRAIAAVPGVDSVLDLMTEPAAAEASSAGLGATTDALALAPPRPRRALRRPQWPAAARILAVGSGLGLSVAALRIRTLFAVPAAALGLSLVASGAAATSRRAGAPREPRPAF